MVSSNNVTPQQLRLLAGLLATPTDESLGIMAELGEQNPWLQESLQELVTISLEHWQTEHTRLFINGHPKTCCPPFESAYRHGRMNGPACDQIEQLYYSVGLEPVEDVPPDYLGMMLECAAYLLEQKTSTSTSQITDDNLGEENIDNSEMVARDFQTLWQNHLAKWVPDFANDLQQHSELHLYRQLGQQLKDLF